MVGITKRYPGIIANRDVTFDVRRGEVHCLLGENGAGKSTLMGILSGMIRPDAGHIRLEGRNAGIDSPRRALDLGIGTVYQHLTLVPAFTVLENLMLGQANGVRLDVDGARRRISELVATLGIELDADARVGSLALGQQQYVEIIKALWRDSAVLILDEPTSMLTPQGVQDLQRALGHLKQQGLAMIFITHKLHEALAMSDRISVLRAGRLVTTMSTAPSSSPEEMRTQIVTAMFGDQGPPAAAPEVAADPAKSVKPPRRLPVGAKDRLELEDVCAGDEGPAGGIRSITFSVAAGEIFGVAGVDGNGQRELAEAIVGQRAMRGMLRLDGRPLGNLSVSKRQRLGLRYVTDDRHGEGIVGSLSVALNLVLKRIGEPPFWVGGRIQKGVIDRHAREMVNAFDVRTPSIHTRAGTLSGGNIQKLLLARELSLDPRVVVFNKPTYGLDLKTAATVRQRIREQADLGVASIVISTELDELLELCHRIAVLYRGRIVGIVGAARDAAERVGTLMIGGEQ